MIMLNSGAGLSGHVRRKIDSCSRWGTEIERATIPQRWTSSDSLVFSFNGGNEGYRLPLETPWQGECTVWDRTSIVGWECAGKNGTCREYGLKQCL